MPHKRAKILKVKYKLLLGFIIIIAFLLRFVNLGVNPPSLSWDEVAWGYNAYSLGIDGRDEFGRFLPLDYLESFGDFKPPVYAYLDVLPVKAFGLSEFSTRIPSAFFGVLTVILTYFLTKEIFCSSKNKKLYALCASLFLAISPWHIMLSRAAFEANISTFFIVLGVYLFLYSIRRKYLLLTLSFASFIVSLYTFNTARIVSPLLVLLLLFSFRRQIMQHKKELLIASVIGLILIIPFAKFAPSPAASLRFKEVNIFSDAAPVEISNLEIKNDKGTLISKIIHNRRLIYSVDYLRHYFDNLNPNFLFVKGDGNPKFSTQDIGELFLWDLPFFIAGIIFLFKKKEGNWWLIPAWLILGIIPAATARETPHALRIETTLPTFQIITSLGFVTIMSNSKFRKFILPVLVLLFLNLTYFLHGYIFHYPREFSGEWQYGYRDSINYVESVKEKYSRVNITEDLGRPYIYYLFYTKYDPKNFRKEAVVKRDAFGFVEVQSFNKYYFYKDLGLVNNKSSLYIDIPDKVPLAANIVKTFYRLNGEPSLVAYEK